MAAFFVDRVLGAGDIVFLLEKVETCFSRLTGDVFECDEMGFFSLAFSVCLQYYGLLAFCVLWFFVVPGS